MKTGPRVIPRGIEQGGEGSERGRLRAESAPAAEGAPLELPDRLPPSASCANKDANNELGELGLYVARCPQCCVVVGTCWNDLDQAEHVARSVEILRDSGADVELVQWSLTSSIELGRCRCGGKLW